MRNELGENTVLIGKADWVMYELKRCYPLIHHYILIHHYMILKSDILIEDVEKIKYNKKDGCLKVKKQMKRWM